MKTHPFITAMLSSWVAVLCADAVHAEVAQGTVAVSDHYRVSVAVGQRGSPLNVSISADDASPRTFTVGGFAATTMTQVDAVRIIRDRAVIVGTISSGQAVAVVSLKSG